LIVPSPFKYRGQVKISGFGGSFFLAPPMTLIQSKLEILAERQGFEFAIGANSQQSAIASGIENQ
jgi:hypothetical protein